MLKQWLLSTALYFVRSYLFTDDNIEKARQDFRTMIMELVEDTETEWDDEAADAILKFMYLDY